MQDKTHTNPWATYARRTLLTLGAISVLCALIASYLYARGYWQWQKDGEAIESPTQRYAISPAVIVYPRLKFGLVMSDRELGREEVVAGWTRSFPWNEEIEWVADDRLRFGVTEEEFDEQVKAATAYIEPAMVVTLGAIIGFVAIALLLPIFQVGKVAAGG